MTTSPRALAGIFMLVASALAWTHLATAATNVCSGFNSFATFDNVVVIQGDTCVLSGFNVVQGNIKVEEGANLFICPDNDVAGNIKAPHGGTTVFITDQPGSHSNCGAGPKALGVTIDGNIDINNGNSFTLIGNPGGVVSVGGNVMVKTTQTVSITSWDGIAGNVIANGNGDVTIIGNTIVGNLKISGTTGTCDDGTSSTPNAVSGNFDGCP